MRLQAVIGATLTATVMLMGCRDHDRPPPYPPGYPAIPQPPPNPTPVFVPVPIPTPAPVPVPPPPPPAPAPTPTAPAPAPAPSASSSASTPAAPLSWLGAYGFDEACGSTAGGTGVVVGHVLRIFRKSGILVAELDADGFQTRTRLRGQAKVQGNVMVIAFDDHAPDDLFKTAYKRGETLLTLVKMEGNLLTLWGAYKPACTDGTGQVYFTLQGG